MSAPTAPTRNRSLILAVRWPDGQALVPTPSRSDALDLLDGTDVLLGERSWLELDPAFRQLIPYVLVLDGTSILRYSRGAAGQEGRLHRLASYGFGGHVDYDDAVVDGGRLDLDATLQVAARRELEEELGIAAGDVVSRRFLGLLAEDSSEVERVHLGWVEAWTVPDVGTVLSREAAIDDLRAVAIDDALGDLSGCEHWSRCALGLLAAAQPVGS